MPHGGTGPAVGAEQGPQPRVSLSRSPALPPVQGLAAVSTQPGVCVELSAARLLKDGRRAPGHEAQACRRLGSRPRPVSFLPGSKQAVMGAACVFLGPPSLAPEGRFPEPALTPGTHLPGSKGPCQPG